MAITPPLAFLSWGVGRLVQPRQALLLELYSQLAARAYDILAHVYLVKLFIKEDLEQRRFKEATNAFYRTSMVNIIIDTIGMSPLRHPLLIVFSDPLFAFTIDRMSSRRDLTPLSPLGGAGRTFLLQVAAFSMLWYGSVLVIQPVITTGLLLTFFLYVGLAASGACSAYAPLID